LEKEHKLQLGAAEQSIERAGHSSEEAIQQLKDSFAKQIKDLENEKESRILELIAQHEAELQSEKDKFVQQADAHEELIAHMKDQHEEVVGKLKIRLESTEDALGNAQSELIRVQEETQGELREVRQAMEEIRKLLALKESETADLERRVQELTDDLENASLSAK
jgi:ribosome recycling factor